jgi:hypothetical protein
MIYTIKNITDSDMILKLHHSILPLERGQEIEVPESIAMALRRTQGLIIKERDNKGPLSLKRSRERILPELEIDYSKYSINMLRSIASGLGLKNYFIKKQELIEYIKERRI